MLLIGLIGASLLLLVVLVARPSLTTYSGGRIFAFLVVVVVPVVAGFGGLETHMERSKTVEFCTSFHPMQNYGKSLMVDDYKHLPAKHYQFSRVPRETACFACHTDYTLYGDYKAKLRGLRHVWVQYLGTVPKDIKLYTPYNNRECLHCHDGSRSFLEAVTHGSEPGQLEKIRSNQLSCMTKGCHDMVHDAAAAEKAKVWSPEEVKK